MGFCLGYSNFDKDYIGASKGLPEPFRSSAAIIKVFEMFLRPLLGFPKVFTNASKGSLLGFQKAM